MIADVSHLNRIHIEFIKQIKDSKNYVAKKTDAEFHNQTK